MDKDLLKRTKIFEKDEDETVEPIDESDQKAIVAGIKTENSKVNFIYKVVFSAIAFFFTGIFLLFGFSSISRSYLFEFQSVFSYLGTFPGYMLLLSAVSLGCSGVYMAKYREKNESIIQLATALGIPPAVFWIYVFSKFPQFPIMYLWLPLGSLGYTWVIKVAVKNLRGTEDEIDELSKKIYHYKTA